MMFADDPRSNPAARSNPFPWSASLDTGRTGGAAARTPTPETAQNAESPAAWPRRRWLLAAAAGLAGCAQGRFSTLSRNLAELDQLAAFHGVVLNAAGERVQATVVALTARDGGWTIGGVTASAGGRYLLRVDTGKAYRLLAFADPDRQRRFDDRAAWALTAPLPAPASRLAPPQNLQLKTAGGTGAPLDAALRSALGDLPQHAARALPVALGDPTTLSDPDFDPEMGLLGLWAPSDFLASVGGGVHRLSAEPSRRLPVVLVHGAAGTPRDLAAVAEALDSDLVQPWVFQYPSGLRLDSAAQMLEGILVDMRRRMPFSAVAVVAHSMGGLVARAAVLRLQASTPALRVPLLASISSPWGGHGAAAWGVRFAPTVVPSWIDMETGSAFQRRLQEQPLPPGTAHHLHFSYRGNGDDGTVSLVSQLVPRIQAGAQRVRGHDEDHSSVLGNAELLADLRAATSAAARGLGRPAAPV